MANITYNNVRISSLSCCVPKNIERNIDLADIMDKSDIENMMKMTGVHERRVAKKDLCTSDLCFHAAQKIFLDEKIEKESIDMLIFVTQTPDYKVPATACILQNRLGLPKTCGAFDVNLGCSGFVYGLSIAFSFAQSAGVGRVLFLGGDTGSKVCNRKDHSAFPLFGDCGFACVIEKTTTADKGANSYFSLCTDGSGEDAIKIRDGGYRNVTSPDSFIEIEDENHNIRNGLQTNVDGMEVFNFTLRCVPKAVKETVLFANKQLSDIDYFVFHQANEFIMRHFCKKMKLSEEKVLIALEKFGNTSSALIPLTIVFYKDIMKKKSNMLLCGYGVGLSWGTCILDMSDCKILPLGEV